MVAIYRLRTPVGVTTRMSGSVSRYERSRGEKGLVRGRTDDGVVYREGRSFRGVGLWTEREGVLVGTGSDS